MSKKPKNVKIISLTHTGSIYKLAFGLGDDQKIYRYVVTDKGGYWELVTL